MLRVCRKFCLVVHMYKGIVQDLLKISFGMIKTKYIQRVCAAQKSVTLKKLLAWLLMRCLKSWFSQSNSDCIRYSKVTRKGNSVKVRAQISCQALMAIIDMVYLSVEAMVIFYVLPRWYKLGVFNRDYEKMELQTILSHQTLLLYSFIIKTVFCIVFCHFLADVYWS